MTDFRSPLSQVCRDRQLLRERLHRVRMAIGERLRRVATASELLMALSQELDQQLDREEDASLFDELVSDERMLEEHREKLQKMHLNLLDRFDALAELALELQPEEDWWVQLESLCKECRTTLRANTLALAGKHLPNTDA